MNSGALSTEAKLTQVKGRIYVAAQTAGWGTFLAMQFAFMSGFRGAKSNHQDAITDYAITAMVVFMGWALTHFARPFMSRWGWKEMGWRALAPRVLAMSFGLSVLWSVVGYGYAYVILGLPWELKVSPLLVFVASTLNGTGMIAGWMCFYFLYHIFERMQRLQIEQLRLVASAKEAELRALKSQVNPHFLFNSLNSLRALIDEDAPRAREAVTRMANMLRYSLQSGQLETVAFEEELRIVEDYLALEQIRHEERLRVRWEVPDALRKQGIPVPPMLLQTLVENAVKYGVGARREGGEITISAQREGATLVIRVTNPGDLSAPTSASAARAGSSTGVGLRNASERLKLLFGERAQLSLRADPAGFVTASVVIPLNSAA